MSSDASADRRGVLPAVVLGVGLGAFVDGVVLHQVLGWHHMASNVRPATDLGSLREPVDAARPSRALPR